MPETSLFERYQDLQNYVGWTAEDGGRVAGLLHTVEAAFDSLVDDFYREIDKHPGARRVITGGPEQIARLQQTLVLWLRELFSGVYDADYVQRRSNVGRRHVEIGLEQIYTNVALSRLRTGLVRTIRQSGNGDSRDTAAAIDSLHRLLDLDLAIIEDAYQNEYEQRRQAGDRLATIGQVAGGVAHELRNPLNVIKTSVYYLLYAKEPTSEKRTEHLQRIERQVQNADGVITALNDFAKLPTPLLLPIELEPCLVEVLESTTLPGHIEVRLIIPASIPHLLGDVRQLKIVFGNLIRNARDAMPSGGRLELAARRTGPDEIEIQVSDTGIGIKREELDRIMEPLYSTKARGIGLGLSITRAIVEKHQGRIRVASEPNVGTQFCVTLPAVSTGTPAVTAMS